MYRGICLNSAFSVVASDGPQCIWETESACQGWCSSTARTASSPAALRAKWPVCWPYTSTTHGCTLLAKQSNIVECHSSSGAVLSVRIFWFLFVCALFGENMWTTSKVVRWRRLMTEKDILQTVHNCIEKYINHQLAHIVVLVYVQYAYVYIRATNFVSSGKSGSWDQAVL